MSETKILDIEEVEGGVRCPRCGTVCKTTSGLSKHMNSAACQKARKKLQEKALSEYKLDKEYAMRSCWNCNAAHEHLKKATYLFTCAWGCGHWYYNGIDITEDSA